MQSSGDAGVVVVSFGSMVTNLTTERSDIIATAFGRIPQKVSGSAHSQTVKYAFRDVRKTQFPVKKQKPASDEVYYLVVEPIYQIDINEEFTSHQASRGGKQHLPRYCI